MKLILGANGQLGTDFKELFDSIGEKYIRDFTYNYQK